MRNTSINGVSMILGAAMLWGTTGTAQSLGPANLSPYWVGALRVFIASLFFAAVILCRTDKQLIKQLAHLRWRWVWLAGACIATYNLTFFAGVKVTGVAVGTAITIGSGPIWAGLLQTLISGKAPRFAWWAGTLFAVTGGSLMVLSANSQMQATSAGVGLCLTAGLVYAVYTLVSKSLVSQTSPAIITLCTFSCAALIAIPAALALSGLFTTTAAGWATVGYLGIVATGVSYLLFSYGLRHISGPSSVTLALAEPATAFALAIVIVHEHPGIAAFAGLGLLLSGLLLIILTEMKTEHKPADKVKA